MDEKIYKKLSQIVHEKSGIALGDRKQALVSARVAKRMRYLGLETHEQYLDHLLEDSTGTEMVSFLDVISTNVTSFYRESKHFDFLSRVMTEWLERGQTRFRFWCAAASTGEEPYTIAMTLKEAVGPRNVDMKLLATDISTRVLEACRVGVYDAKKMEPVPLALQDRYFTRVNGGPEKQYAVKDSLKRMIVFKRLNLSKPPFPMHGPLDLVFCRNVMIYFDNDVRRRLLGDIYRLVKPGGYLLVGHSESLTGLVSDFRLVEASIYTKD